MVLKMMSNQFSGDQVFDYGETATSELSKPPPPPPSECPRCGSTNTKFCYYNNYNKSQPRYLCRSCKRHWTKGGTLRSIPAGRRHRNKRPRTSNAAAATPASPRQERFSTDQSDKSDILYQALVRSSSSVPHSTILESYGTTYAAPAPQSQNSELITFLNSTSINSTSNYQFSGENLDTTEESTVMTGAAPQWTAANPSAAAELWSSDNEIGFLGSNWGDPYAVWDEFDAYKPIFEGY